MISILDLAENKYELTGALEDVSREVHSNGIGWWRHGLFHPNTW